MAVYTEVSSALLTDALSPFDLQLQGSPHAVADGIENTTYFFRASRESGDIADYVLTVFEQIPLNQIQFAIALTQQLATSQLPVPAPYSNRQGNVIFSIAGKNALIFPKARGQHLEQPGPEECTIIGEYLAHAHISSAKLTVSLKNSRGLSWLTSALTQLQPRLSAADLELLNRQIFNYHSLKNTGDDLPSGAIHGDLFKDNALFLNGKLSGVIDFYNACTDWFLIDVAIAVNDWCIDKKTGEVNRLLAADLLEAYHSIRPFTENEMACWYDVVDIAAARFWVSRLLGQHGYLGLHTRTKNPDEYRQRLLSGRTNLPTLPH